MIRLDLIQGALPPDIIEAPDEGNEASQECKPEGGLSERYNFGCGTLHIELFLHDAVATLGAVEAVIVLGFHLCICLR